jgi:hypothetical protein
MIVCLNITQERIEALIVRSRATSQRASNGIHPTKYHRNESRHWTEVCPVPCHESACKQWNTPNLYRCPMHLNFRCICLPSYGGKLCDKETRGVWRQQEQRLPAVTKLPLPPPETNNQPTFRNQLYGHPARFASGQNLNEDSTRWTCDEQGLVMSTVGKQNAAPLKAARFLSVRVFSRKLLSAGVYCHECHALRYNANATFVNWNSSCAIR